MSEIGILTDFEGSTARIDDKPISMFDAAAGYCQKHWPMWKKCKVEYELRDGKISKIWLAAEGNKQPQQQATVPATKETCTSPPEKPAASSSLKTVEGQITAIDHAAHKITVKDRAGQQHTMVWPPQFNDPMAKLKQWWFCKITGEHVPDVDLWKLTAQDFFKRPDDWPASAHGGNGGGRAYIPKNDKIVVYQCCYKEACETARSLLNAGNLFNPDGDKLAGEALFNRVMDIALARALKDAAELCKAGGA